LGCTESINDKGSGNGSIRWREKEGPGRAAPALGKIIARKGRFFETYFNRTEYKLTCAGIYMYRNAE
jgi:hypothetical protein